MGKLTRQEAPKLFQFMMMLPTAKLWLINKINIIIVALSCKMIS